VLIEWEDACQHSEGVTGDPLTLCRSAGFAWRQGDAIILSWHDHENGWPENCTPVFSIPVAGIKAITMLSGDKTVKYPLRRIPREKEGCSISG
jgi:hypothetical protein